MSPSPCLPLSAYGGWWAGLMPTTPTRQDLRGPTLYRSCAKSVNIMMSHCKGSKYHQCSRAVEGVILTHVWVNIILMSIWPFTTIRIFYITFYLLGFIFTKQWEREKQDRRCTCGLIGPFGAWATGISELLMWRNWTLVLVMEQEVLWTLSHRSSLLFFSFWSSRFPY